MATHLTDLELSIIPPSVSPAATELHKAWHLLSILLSIRRPATIAELCSRCTLFPASPGLVEYLCSIPNSPLFLTANLLVTLSPVSLVAFGEFLSNSNLINVFTPRVGFGISSPMLRWEDERMCFRKRRRRESSFEYLPLAKRRYCLEPENGNERDGVGPLQETVPNDLTKVQFHLADNVIESIKRQQCNTSSFELDLRNFNEVMVMPALLGSSSSGQLTSRFKNVELLEGSTSKNIAVYKKVDERVHILECQHKFCHQESFPNIPSQITSESVLTCGSCKRPTPPTITLGSRIVCEEANENAASPNSITDFSTMCCQEEVKENNASSMMVGYVASDFEVTNDRIVEAERTMVGREVELLNNIGCSTEENENISPKLTNKVNCTMQPLEKKQRSAYVERQSAIPSADISVSQQLSKPYSKTKTAMTPTMQSLKSIEQNKVASTSKEQQHYKRNQTPLKKNRNDAHIKQRREKSTIVSPKDQMEPKALPNFESFIVEEEEGSGGYGTVYKAKRKSDGLTVAIKCPHADAHKHHVTNELRMLERFGGKNFVIKYEGCFKSNGSDCFVLEHVEHDRPEVLKKDIDVFQLQWYGYCMFKALASLHKQGIVHRDVKPGNFLFSRKNSKGYLIDFNLAMDLHQKYGTTNKAKGKYDVSFGLASLPSTKSISTTKFSTSRSAAVDKEAIKSSKSTLEKNLKRKAVEQKMACNTLGSWNVTKSQGADGSGITSARDVTSTRTPSAERLREPLPSHGRKELLKLLQEAMQTPNHGASHVPAPLRKRVAASPGQLDKTFVYPTPMPLHSTRLAVAGAGLTKNRGDGKLKKEGPCVGTKGFRAPEVLFRSTHQGPKVDVWSAGVTLLYLIIGRTPFFGDPEQNIKEIAKLRGSEDLWEVAKLHNRESSFPVELYDASFLSSPKLRDWCEANTKRPDFFKVMPRSLLDLVDKCLTVNPRMRISAEEALRHEFFAPCHEGLRKQRLIRQGLSFSSDSATSRPSFEHTTNHRPLKLKVADEQ